MNNVTIVNGWLGTGVANLAAIGGPAIDTARPRHGQVVVFGDGMIRPSGEQQA